MIDPFLLEDVRRQKRASESSLSYHLWNPQIKFTYMWFFLVFTASPSDLIFAVISRPSPPPSVARCGRAIALPQLERVTLSACCSVVMGTGATAGRDGVTSRGPPVPSQECVHMHDGSFSLLSLLIIAKICFIPMSTSYWSRGFSFSPLSQSEGVLAVILLKGFVHSAVVSLLFFSCSSFKHVLWDSSSLNSHSKIEIGTRRHCEWMKGAFKERGCWE